MTCLAGRLQALSSVGTAAGVAARLLLLLARTHSSGTANDAIAAAVPQLLALGLGRRSRAAAVGHSAFWRARQQLCGLLWRAWRQLCGGLLLARVCRGHRGCGGEQSAWWIPAGSPMVRGLGRSARRHLGSWPGRRRGVQAAGCCRSHGMKAGGRPPAADAARAGHTGVVVMQAGGNGAPERQAVSRHVAPKGHSPICVVAALSSAGEAAPVRCPAAGDAGAASSPPTSSSAAAAAAAALSTCAPAPPTTPSPAVVSRRRVQQGAGQVKGPQREAPQEGGGATPRAAPAKAQPLMSLDRTADPSTPSTAPANRRTCVAAPWQAAQRNGCGGSGLRARPNGQAGGRGLVSCGSGAEQGRQCLAWTQCSVVGSVTWRLLARR